MLVGVPGTGFRVLKVLGFQGFEFGVRGFGGAGFQRFRVWSTGFRVSGFRGAGVVFRDSGFRVRVFMVWGWRFGAIEVRGFWYGVS